MHDITANRCVRPDWLEIGYRAAADSWPLRSFHVEPLADVPRRGSLLFQTGRADFFEKYLESFEHWRKAGWSIDGFDWRGQGGSGRLVGDEHAGHGAPYDTMLTDLDGFAADWLHHTSAPHMMIGHSMGAHVILRWLSEFSPQIDGAVLIAPMLGLNSAPVPEWLAKKIARAAIRFGLAEKPAWKESASGNGHRQRNLTHSLERFQQEMRWRTQEPMLDVGPPTWGWLADSWRSIATLQAPDAMERITVPLLILYASQDRLVKASAVLRTAQRLAAAQVRCSSEAAHELLREADLLRSWALKEIDDFLSGIPQRTDGMTDN
jgi:lysophospholipase